MSAAQRSDIVLSGDPHRVLCRLFIPGEEELIRGTSRATELAERCLRLTDEQVRATLADVLDRYDSRHRDLTAQLQTHFAAVAANLPHAAAISPERQLLIGAYLTQEYAFESTAYFNPSLVLHPDQSELPVGSARFIMSIRAVGEGHLSSLVFRTGTISADAEISVDPPSPFATTRATHFTVLRSRMVQQAAIEAGVDTPALQFVLGMLPDTFTPEELYARLSALPDPHNSDEDNSVLTTLLHDISRRCYEVDFDPESDLSERVMWPTARDERRGIEDARFVLFTDERGQQLYRATYTGFDGTQVVSRVLETEDFRAFTSMPLTGKAVRNKGVAFFPRLIDGHYLALSRWDRESNSIASSDDGYHWNDGATFHMATEPWELVHVGNCGSPIETGEGWLVLTHGAGPMREYSIGAALLDTRDPTRVLATYPGALLTPQADERDGYVPNVIYSCGGLIHNGTLVVPYGVSDCLTRVALFDTAELLSRMSGRPSRRVLV